jgi:hypothetical protein
MLLGRDEDRCLLATAAQLPTGLTNEGGDQMNRLQKFVEEAPIITDASLRNFSCSRHLPRSTSAGVAAMQEIKPDQLWEEGLHQVRIINAFGVRVVIRRDGVDVDEEIAEDDFRKRFQFVADR